VSCHKIRLETRLLEQFIQPYTQRSNCRLGVLGAGKLLHQGLSLGGSKHRARVYVRRKRFHLILDEHFVHCAEYLTHGREVHRQFTAHLQILRALSREQRHHLALRVETTAPVEDPLGVFPAILLGLTRQPVDAQLEHLARLIDRLSHKAYPRLFLRNRQRAAGADQVIEAHLRLPALQILERIPASFEQLRRVCRAQQHGLGHRIQSVCPAVLALDFFEHDMKVSPTKAKRADPRAAWVAVLRTDPWARLGIQIKRCLVDTQFGIGSSDVNRWRQHLVIQRQRRLDQAGGPGGRFGMANLRLHAAQGNALPAFVVLAKDFFQPFELSRISGYRTCSVRLNHANRSRLETGFRIGAPQCLGLTGRTRGVNTLVATIAGRSNRLDDRIYPVTVTLGIFQTLQYNHAQALAHDHATRFGIE